MILGHRIQLLPTKEQNIALCRAAGVARFIYNWALATWKEWYDLQSDVNYASGSMNNDLLNNNFGNRGFIQRDIPTHSIVKLSGTSYALEVPCIGFSKDQLEIVQKKNLLTISGKNEKPDLSRKQDYIQRSFTNESFVKTISLPENAKINDTSLQNDMLTLKINLPEDMDKGQIIQIK